MIFIGSDHAGYQLKEEIQKFLIERGESVNDVGTDSPESCDYPDFAEKVAKAVSQGQGKGILFCKSGQGMAIAANKIKGVRASIVWNEEIAKETRADNDSNILCIPAGYLNEEQTKNIVLTWLSTPFSSADRHLNRIKKISKLEN
jgi:ribose 5-phosphate isomerase B